MSDGSFEIDGNFSAEEVSVILEVGLNALYQAGALPLMAIDKQELAKVQPFSGEIQ